MKPGVLGLLYALAATATAGHDFYSGFSPLKLTKKKNKRSLGGGRSPSFTKKGPGRRHQQGREDVK